MMFLDITYNNGNIERGVKCVAIESKPKLLEVYPTRESWKEGKPIHCIDVKQFIAWDDQLW